MAHEVTIRPYQSGDEVGILALFNQVFGENNPVSKFLTSVINYVPKAVVAIVILGITAALARFVGDLVQRGTAAAKFPPVLAKIAPIAVWVIGVFAAVDQLGIAKNVVSDLFRAILVVIAGSAVIAIGGGGSVDL